MIVITGASSFTGFHFTLEIAKYKKIICFSHKKFSSYKDLKKTRLQILKKNKNIKLIFNCSFGSEKMIRVIKSYKNICFCFHHAQTLNAKDDFKFSFLESFNQDLYNIDNFFKKCSNNIKKIIFSSSIFQKEHSKQLIDFNKYSLNKSITLETLKFFCHKFNIRLINFVISNPFGVLEDRRYSFYLLNNWINKSTPIVGSPDFIREYIYIDDLKKLYFNATKLNLNKNYKEIKPRGLKMTNLKFANFLKNNFTKYISHKIYLSVKKSYSTEPKNISFNGNSNYNISNSKIKEYFEYYLNHNYKNNLSKN